MSEMKKTFESQVLKKLILTCNEMNKKCVHLPLIYNEPKTSPKWDCIWWIYNKDTNEFIFGYKGITYDAKYESQKDVDDLNCKLHMNRILNHTIPDCIICYEPISNDCNACPKCNCCFHDKCLFEYRKVHNYNHCPQCKIEWIQ